MNTLPVIQNFFGKPVRFFKTEFTPDLYPRYGDTGSQKTLLKTWAIPLPDYCDAIGYPVKKIFDMIQRNRDVFDGFYRHELILDRFGGQQRRTILVAIEMCDGLNMKLHTTRIKDPAVRESVTRFQRFMIYAFHLLRTGRLRGVRWNLSKDVPAEVLAILSLPSGREHKQSVLEYAKQEGICLGNAYRRLKSIRGSNIITKKGKPKENRSNKGSTHYPEERQKAITYKAEHLRAMGKEIKEAMSLTVSSNTVNRWISIHAA